MEEARLAPQARAPLAALVGTLLLAAAVSGIVVYKSTGAMKAIAKAQSTGALAAKARWLPLEGVWPWARPLVDALNYFSWVLVALLFGVLIGALIRAAFPERWLSRALGAPGAWGTLWGAALGLPLMLCSCCIAPVFDGAYARTRRLGPSLSLMLSAPGLNPADLTIVFLVFPRTAAVARLVLSLALVLGAGLLASRRVAEGSSIERSPIDEPQPSWPAFFRSLAGALGDTVRRSLPAILLGALCSAAILLWASPAVGSAAGNPALVVTLAVAVVATLVALPTFGEIPLALTLQLAGAPVSAVVAVLVAGPIINLPSLFVLRRSTSWRVASTVGASVLATAFLGGELAALIAS